MDVSKKIEEKIEKYLNEREGGTRVLPIPEAEIAELIFDFAAGENLEVFDEWDYEKNKLKPKKERDKVDKKVNTIINNLEKYMNDPSNIKKFARAKKESEFMKMAMEMIKDYAKKIKGKNDVADAFVQFTKNKKFMDQLSEMMVELYKYIEPLRDKEKY